MYYVRYWRERQKLTQAELACRVDVHLNTVNRWENGHREPRAKDIIKLCRVLGVTETELMNGPARTELMVNFFWECDDMNAAVIKANEFSWGYRSDGMLIITGALPWDMSVDDIIARIKAELVAAKEGKKARDAALEKGVSMNAGQDVTPGTDTDASKNG